TRRCGLPHPSQQWRSPLPAAPPPSSVDRRRRADPLRRWTGHPPASVPALPRLLQPHVKRHPPPNSPAATAAPLSCLCTPVRIEPLPAACAPKVPDPIQAATSLTQGEGAAGREPPVFLTQV